MDLLRINPFHQDFDDLFENTTIGYVLTQPSGEIFRVNRIVASWMEADPAEYYGRDISELFSVGGRVLMETHLAPLLKLQGKVDEIAVELVTSSGGRVPVLLNAVERQDEQGTPLSVLYSFFKATDRLKYEQNLRLARMEAEQVLATERETSALREQFIAILGHDLRSPLQSVTLAASMLRTADEEEARERLITIIESGADRMNRLISDILDLARGRLGSGITVVPEPVDLAELLTNLVAELQVAAQNNLLELSSNTPGLIQCDPVRLSQLVTNLVTNAVAHGAQDQPVKISATADSRSLRLSVTNQGDPIPAEALKTIFEPYVRSQGAAPRQGLGLGLYIASEIAKAHGGSLSVTSTNEATTFMFVMPLVSSPT